MNIFGFHICGDELVQVMPVFAGLVAGFSMCRTWVRGQLARLVVKRLK